MAGFQQVTVREVRSNDLRKKSPLEWYNEEISKKPKDVGLWYAKGAMLAKMGEHHSAIECFRTVTRLDPNHLKGWDATAKAYFRIGDYDNSILALDRLLELDEGNESIWFHKGEALLKLGRFDEAVECYDKAIELNRNYTDAWCGKGNALKGIGKEEPRGVGESNDVAESNEELFDDAMECYRMALSQNPQHYKAMGARGTLLCEMGRYEDGLKYINEATEGDPHLYEQMILKANVLRTKGRDEESARLLQGLLSSMDTSAGKESVERLYWKGIAGTGIDNHQSALGNFDRILALNPRHVETWIAKGDVLSKKGDRGQALDCYNTALSLRPNMREVWHRKGNIQRDLGMVNDALLSYQKATSVATTGRVDASFDTGLQYYVTEDLREALRSFLQVLELNPSHTGARKMKAEVESRLFSRVEGAIETSRKILGIREGQSYPLVTGTREGRALSKDEFVYHGIRFFSQEEFKEALKCFEQAIELDDEDYTIWEWKGDTLVKLDRYSEAIECYERAVKMKHTKSDDEGEESIVSNGSKHHHSGRRTGDGGSGAFETERSHAEGAFGITDPKKIPRILSRGENLIDDEDMPILNVLQDKPRTLYEIQVLCQTHVTALYPRVESLCAQGFLKRIRPVITLKKGARRICLYQMTDECHWLLGV